MYGQVTCIAQQHVQLVVHLPSLFILYCTCGVMNSTALVNSCHALCTTDCTIMYHKALLCSLEVERTSLYYTLGCNGTAVCSCRMSYYLTDYCNTAPPENDGACTEQLQQISEAITHKAYTRFRESEPPRFGTDLGPTRFGIRLHRKRSK